MEIYRPSTIWRLKLNLMYPGAFVSIDSFPDDKFAGSLSLNICNTNIKSLENIDCSCVIF